jgi:hypothetical protein
VKRLLLLTTLLIFAGGAAAQGLRPFLVHDPGRTPQQAWTLLKTRGQAHAVAHLFARQTGMTDWQVYQRIELGQYVVRPIVGIWSSYGWGPDGRYGTIIRAALPGELGAYFEGIPVPVLSGTCGNPGREKPGEGDLNCRTGPRKAGATQVFGVQTDWGSTLFSCE